MTNKQGQLGWGAKMMKLDSSFLSRRDPGEKYFDITIDRVVKRLLNCGIEKVEIWASHWLDGSDRSSDAAYAAYDVVADSDSISIIADIIYSAFMAACEEE